ncbi:hypothetical protein H0Z60_03220 [Ectothiorhodospiraceae bacterium WFHF3C12]|nr:hypothetical protein [Ectothiorhodospiraceae bacterium WFHF3C12]
MRILAVAVLALALAGCGWHLRGSQGASLGGQRIAVINDTQSRPLLRDVEAVLADVGASVVDAGAGSDARLQLLRQRFSRRTLAGAGDDGIAEYELAYELRFRVLGPDETPWSEAETVRAADSYEVNEANVLAGEARRDDLSVYLREQAVRLMAARLQAAIDRNRDSGE